MADDFRAKVITPATLDGTGEVGPFPIDLYTCRYLAQGDSWFSIGSFPPGATSNTLEELKLARSTLVVNCAFPGKQLAHMTDTISAVPFLRLLTGNLALRWDAILLSGGGNDLIDAATVGPQAPAAQRLFATTQERGPGPLQPDDYVSAPGWKTFADHLTQVFDHLVALRDSGMNAGTPLAFHTYAHLMPRPAPAGLGFGPWLAPALTAFAVPSADWLPVASMLIDRLAALMTTIVAAKQAANPNCALHLIDTRNAPLQLSQAGATGRSGDFQNEIHLTRDGYAKLGAVWAQTLDVL